MNDWIVILDTDAGFRTALAGALAPLLPDRQVAAAAPDDPHRPAAALALCGLNVVADRAWIDRVARDAEVLVLLGGTEPPDGLEWIAKPVRLADLVTQVQRRGRRDPALLSIGPYRFDAAAKQLLRGDRRVRLTEKETALLDYLAGAAGAVAREQLLAEIWGYGAGLDTHTLETLVYRLRRKIERDPAHAELLVTEGGGYRLVR